MKKELCVFTFQITEDGKTIRIKKQMTGAFFQLPSGTGRLREVVLKTPATRDDAVIFKTCVAGMCEGGLPAPGRLNPQPS